MPLTPAGRYPRYRVPRDDGQTLCVPPWSAASELLARNRAEIMSRDGDLLGQSVVELTRTARSAVADAAADYTRSYADVPVPSHADLPMVVTGHQPGFVHPGVWLKNFAAAQLAADSGGVAISLVIDSDLCRSTSILVPTGSVAEPRCDQVPYDGALAQTPWEERRLADRATWQSFGTRAAQTLAPLVPAPLVSEWWPEVIAEGREQGRLSSALSQARHRLERAWGNKSCEIPQSLVCQTAPFRRFMVSLLAAAERFRAAHNQSLAEYRREHRLRNHAQPMPDLALADDWIEAPYWLWSTSDPSRRALFVKPMRNELRLSDRAAFHETLPFSPGGDATEAIQRLAEWEARGLKLRTRALMTTMFARMFLADVFIHGIGGAKYDQVTDAICERMFGFRPPAHVTLTGTLRLPIPHAADSSETERHLRQALRDLRFHPETSLADQALSPSDRQQVDQLVEQKRTWVRTARTSENAAERHCQIVAANEALAVWTAARREQLEQELRETDHRQRGNQLLDSREYPFCLFPHDLLRSFLLDFSPRMP